MDGKKKKINKLLITKKRRRKEMEMLLYEQFYVYIGKVLLDNQQRRS